MEIQDLHRAPPVGLVRPVRLDPAGVTGPTRGAARSRAWRPAGHGWYVASTAPDIAEQRILEVAARLPDGAMVTGWAALCLAGGGWFDGIGARGDLLPVPVLLPHGRRMRRPDVLEVRSRRELPTVVTRHDIPCAPSLDATLVATHLAPELVDAVVVLDMSRAAKQVDDEPLARGIARHAGAGCHCAAAFGLSTGDARSPRETRTRVVWEVDAGLPRPLGNREILALDGTLLAIGDLLDVEAGVVGEYDGAAHRTRARHRRDAKREADLRGVGLELFTIVAGDSAREQVARMQGAYRRALRLPEHRRRWKVGRLVLPDPPVPESASETGPAWLGEEDRAAYDAMMLAHHRALDESGSRTHH